MGNEASIVSHGTRLTTNEASIADHGTRLTTNEASIDDHTNEIKDLKRIIANLTLALQNVEPACINSAPLSGFKVKDDGLKKGEVFFDGNRRRSADCPIYPPPARSSASSSAGSAIIFGVVGVCVVVIIVVLVVM